MFDVFPENYADLLNKKVRHLTQLFDGIPHPEIDLFESPPSHFRMRAEFRIWHEQDEINYVMFDKLKKNAPIIINDFPRANRSIANLMQPLLIAIRENDTLSKRLFQIDFLSSSLGEVLVTLIYHKTLDEQWRNTATELQKLFNIKVIGRARKQKEILSEDFIMETFEVDNKTLEYQHVENSFTQPNATVCEKMLNWVVRHSNQSSGDLLELYCGNGNFTLALAKNFRKILATEVSKVSVKSARYNMKLNHIKNIEIVRLSSEEITQALNKEREFRRLEDINLDDYDFNTLFVDPPRAGLDEQTVKLAKQFERIIYVSCNPYTLVENIKMLGDYRVENMALFDQFPYTEHMECGVILVKTA